MRNSLTLRLVATSIAWVGATLLITAVLLVVLFRGHIEQRFETLLLDHLEELVAASELTPEGTLQMTWRPSDPRFNRPHSGSTASNFGWPRLGIDVGDRFSGLGCSLLP